MTGKRKRRLQQLAEAERKHTARRSRRRWAIAVATVAALAAGVFAIWLSRNNPPSKTASLQADEKWPLSTLLALKPHQLADIDIALMNLPCAEGLRGSESLDVDKALASLDEMATRIRVETDRHMYRFHANRAEYQDSEAYFRMLMFVAVLQQDFGIRYNPARISEPGLPEPNEKFSR